MIAIVIPGKPMGKARPRVTRKVTYTPKSTVDYQNLVKLCYMQQCDNIVLDGEIKANIIAYYPIPKNTSKKKRQAMLNEEIRPTKKPDLDNVAKIILDSLNKVAYKDDNQIVELKIEKYYSEVSRVELQLEEI